MPKALIVVTNHKELGNTGRQTGYYLPEVTHPFYVLEEAGFQIDFLSPKGGAGAMDEKSRELTDPENKKFLESKELMNKLDNTFSPADISPTDYDAIIFAGGHGTMWDFPDDEPLAKTTAAIYENGGVVAAICHGPSGVVNVKLSDGTFLVQGKTVAAFTNEEEASMELTEVMPFLLEDKLIERGAKIQKAAPWQESVAVSERLVTGQNPASARGVGHAVVKLLQQSKASAQ